MVFLGLLASSVILLLGTPSQSLWDGIGGSKTQRPGAGWPEEQRSQNATGIQDGVLSGLRPGLFLLPSIQSTKQNERGDEMAPEHTVPWKEKAKSRAGLL